MARVWKDYCCLSSATEVEGKFGQPKKCCVQFRPGSVGAEHYCPTSVNLAGLSSCCVHPSFSQQEYFEPAPNGSISSYLRDLQRCAIAAAGLPSDEYSGGKNFCHRTLICLPSEMAHPSLQWEWFAPSWPSFPYPSCFRGCVSCAGDRAVPGKGSLDIHCSQPGKGRQRAVTRLHLHGLCLCVATQSSSLQGMLA